MFYLAYDMDGNKYHEYRIRGVEVTVGFSPYNIMPMRLGSRVLIHKIQDFWNRFESYLQYRDISVMAELDKFDKYRSLSTR